MSLVKIQGNASGTGEFTIAAPNSNTNRVLTLPDNTGTILTTGGTIAASQLPAGSVLQVVQTTKTNTFTISSTSFTDITGLSVSITPISASNKILVFGDISVGGATGNYVIIQLVRGSTAVYIGTEALTFIGTRNWFPNSSADNASMGSLSAIFLDSPATTSSTTYKFQVRVTGGTGRINARSSTEDTSMASSITVMEIAA
jgi:hypothetical protein